MLSAIVLVTLMQLPMVTYSMPAYAPVYATGYAPAVTYAPTYAPAMTYSASVFSSAPVMTYSTAPVYSAAPIFHTHMYSAAPVYSGVLLGGGSRTVIKQRGFGVRNKTVINEW